MILKVDHMNQSNAIKTLRSTEVLTVKQVQMIMQCGKEKAYELVHSGQFPVKYLGSKDFRIPTSSFFSWLETSDLPIDYKESYLGR